MPCHEATGSKTRDGYRMHHLGQHPERDTGARSVAGKPMRIPAHREVYAEAVGLLALGPVIAHSCDNPGCDEPSHLWATDILGNIRDAAEKGRMGKNRTACFKGHPYVEGSFRVSKEGWRQCRICRRKWDRARRGNGADQTS